jgi:hypothetical protein
MGGIELTFQGLETSRIKPEKIIVFSISVRLFKLIKPTSGHDPGHMNFQHLPK